jgi:hypothetical protein
VKDTTPTLEDVRISYKLVNLSQARHGVSRIRGGPLVFQAWKVYYKNMKEAIPKKHGGRRCGSGRPATGKDPVRTVRLSDEFIATIDAWSVKQPDNPSRSEAIRQLVERGLKTKGK